MGEASRCWRVAHVMGWVSRSAGGLLESVSGMARAEAAMQGLEVAVFGAGDRFTAEDDTVWGAVPVRSGKVLGPPRLCYVPRMRRMIEVFSPDLIHSAAVWTAPARAVNLIHARKKVPYVLSIRGTLDPWALGRSHARKWLAKQLFQERHFDQAACIHALNELEAGSIRAYGLSNAICMIPNGVNLPSAESLDADPGERESWRRSSGCQNACRVLLFLGRLHRKKGLVPLLRAWARVRAGHDWVLAIAGWDDGDHEGELLRLCEELGLPIKRLDEGEKELKGGCSAAKREVKPLREGMVLFLGPRFGKEKEAAFRACDAFILPSFSEGLPMAVLEAWSYAKPVLMTPECNLPEGFAADAAIRIEPTADSIEEALRNLVATKDSRLAEIGRSGRQLVADKFSWPKIAREMKCVYDWVLGGGEKPNCIYDG